MLSKSEFDAWCDRLGLSHQTQELIERIRSTPPYRHVGGGSKNVSGRYPSRKMGVTIQFESHKVELSRIYQLEHDEDVLEFYDQPAPIKLDYQGKNGRQLGVFHTPDFFVLRKNLAGWEECKIEEELKKLSQKSPHRYVFSPEGCWRSPPGEKYAAQFGLSYCLRSDSEINWNLQRNLVFLEDYLRTESLTVEPSKLELILAFLADNPGIRLSELLSNLLEISADDIYTLIANEQIYVDLKETLLAEPNKCPVFLDSQIAKAYTVAIDSTPRLDFQIAPVVDLTIGTAISWDGKALSILHVGETSILLRGDGEKLVELKKEEFEALVRQGKIINSKLQAQPKISTEAWEHFYKASPEDQAEALRRYEVIKPYLQGEKRDGETTSERTIRDWKAKYLAAQQKHGCGYLGLLSHRSAKGNRGRKLPLSSLTMMEQFILEDYETLKQKKMWAVYCSLVDACEQKGVIAPSYKTFTKEVKRRSSYQQTLKRKGRRAAYQKQSFYWELTKTTPKHGDRPFEIGHIDHTQLDVELVCSHTGRPLGRPWATFLIDAFSRRFLAVYITFDSPSYRSCLMVLRLCVQRHGRLPQIIVVDNGAEFHSTYFETLLATFECTKKHRPAAKGRFGSVCERLFGTNNTQFIHNLLGNTQIMRNVRQVTKSVNPKNQAIWTLGLLYEYICKWAYEIYDTEDHPALGQSPREAFATGMLQGGDRIHRLIPFDENFKILTLPTTSSGRAKIQTSQGIKINYIYYWSNLFRDPEIENTTVPVRYDPFNAGIAYAFVKGQWIECVSQYYTEFQGRSEKELKLATTELIKRQKTHHKQSKISAKKLAEFLSSIEAQEVLLEQRLHDTEAIEIFKVIEGGKASSSSDYSDYKQQNSEKKEDTKKSPQSNLISFDSEKITQKFDRLDETEQQKSSSSPSSNPSETLIIYEEF